MKEAVVLLVTSGAAAYLPSIPIRDVGVAEPVNGGGDEFEVGDEAADVDVVDSF